MPGDVSSLIVSAPGGTIALAPPPDDWVPPSYTDSTLPHRMQVAVAQIRPFAWLGELVHVNVPDGFGENLDGGAHATITIPVNAPTLALLTDEPEEWGAVTTGRWALLNRQFHIVEDGVRSFQPLVCRDPVTESNGVYTLNLDSKTRLFEDRTHGKAQNTDLLNGNGNFPGLLDIEWLGWQSHGDLEVDEVDGARDGRGVAIRGDLVPRTGAPVGDYLSIRKRITVTETTAFNNIIRATAFVKVPASARPDRLLMAVEVWDSGGLDRLWPEPGDGNKEAAVVDEEASSDDWTAITAKAVLPRGPYSVDVYVEIYPTSTTDWLEVDEVELIQRDNLSSGVPVDLTHHLALIVEDAQNEAKGKTSLGLPVREGAATGTEETLVIWREDAPPTMDALAGVTGRYGGPDPVWVDIQGKAVCEARRGDARDDITLSVEHGNLLRVEGFSYDPGAQVSEVRGLMDVGSDYYRHTAVARALEQTEGMLIERVERVPNGMGLRAADEWVQAELAQQSQPQETGTFWVPAAFGWTVNVGDSFRAVWVSGGVPFGVRHDRIVRVVERVFHPGLRQIALRCGTDDAEELRPARRRGWDSVLGRDRHAVGKGLVPTLGWSLREPVKQPKRYRPPPIEQYTFSDDWTGGAVGSNSFVQDVGEGLWSVDMFAAASPVGLGFTSGRMFVSVSWDPPGGPSVVRLLPIGFADAEYGGSVSTMVQGPTTVTINSQTGMLAGDTVNIQYMEGTITRNTPAPGGY